MTDDEQFDEPEDLADNADLPTIPEGAPRLSSQGSTPEGLRRRLARASTLDDADDGDDEEMDPGEPEAPDSTSIDKALPGNQTDAGPTILANALPTARAYAAARWAELNEPDAPWFARGDGIGVRLRLRELLDTSRARAEGAATDARVNALRKEARKVLWETQQFLKHRHQAIAQHLYDALTEKEPPLPTGGIPFSTVEAAYNELQGAPETGPDAGKKGRQLRQALIEEIDHLVGAAKDVDGLRTIDEAVELLDAELAYDGHSAAWRLGVAQQVKARFDVEPSADVAQVIRETIDGELAGWPRTLRFIVPVKVSRSRKQTANGAVLSAEDLVKQLSYESLTVPTSSGIELGTHAFEKTVEGAADLASGVERLDEWIEQEAAMFRLHGGELEILPVWMHVTETSGMQSIEPLDRPEQLWLLPDGLAALSTLLGTEPARSEGPDGEMAEAFMQLAQARTSVPGPAVSDLWAVTEAVFSGVAADSGMEAAHVMAGLISYLYPLALLTWIGERLIALGVPFDGTETPGRWALGQLEEWTVAWGVTQADTDPLLYARMSRFGRWGPDNGSHKALRIDLQKIRSAVVGSAERAYLVRNYHVHRAQPQRATALSATLPVFAEHVRQALGHVARTEDRRQKPIVAAKVAAMRIEQAAADYEAGGHAGGDALRKALKDDL